MKESEKKILKQFAVKAQRECGLRSRKKHVPMTRMILLECSTSDKIESIDDVKICYVRRLQRRSTISVP